MNKLQVTAMPATPSSADADAGASRFELSRRALLKLSLLVAGVVAAGDLVTYLEYQAAPAGARSFELEAPNAYPPGSATHLAQAGPGCCAMPAACTRSQPSARTW